MSIDSDYYAYRVPEAIKKLPEIQQRQIEWLRANKLNGYADKGKAKVCNNHPEIEYCFCWKTENLRIKYYLRFKDKQPVITEIKRGC